MVGWREWVALPDLDVAALKAKIDTGATTSALHAFDLTEDPTAGTVSFGLHPFQRDSRTTIRCVCPLIDRRHVRSSTGHRELRPVIETTLSIGEHEWRVAITLTSRDAMGFRMLLGRQALRRRAMVDPARSFVASSRPTDTTTRRTP